MADTIHYNDLPRSPQGAVICCVRAVNGIADPQGEIICHLPTASWHFQDSPTGYGNHKCRCSQCRDSWARSKRNLRTRKTTGQYTPLPPGHTAGITYDPAHPPPPLARNERGLFECCPGSDPGIKCTLPNALWHGKDGGYVNHGCRCDKCKEAHRRKKKGDPMSQDRNRDRNRDKHPDRKQPLVTPLSEVSEKIAILPAAMPCPRCGLVCRPYGSEEHPGIPLIGKYKCEQRAAEPDPDDTADSEDPGCGHTWYADPGTSQASQADQAGPVFYDRIRGRLRPLPSKWHP